MKTSIFKTFVLSLCIIANIHFAYGQTASILPPAKTTFFDQNGNPLTSGTVDFYIPSTTTRKTTWQNAAETIANTNPVVLDAAGRALILGSGDYRQVVKDRLGNTIWDQVTSSTGSGSSGPIATGDGDLVGTIKPWAGMTAPSQYAFTYGQEISRTTYSVLFTAITSTQAVFCNSGSAILNGLSDTTNFWVGMAVEISCLAAGNSTVVSKTATTVTLAANANVTIGTNAIFFPWGRGNGSTTFNLPDFRGFAIAGNNNMGGVASAQLTTTYFGATDPNSIGAAGGSQSKVLLAANLPAYTPTGTIANGAITTAITPSGIYGGTVAGVSGGSGNNTPLNNVAIGATSTQATSTFTGAAQGGTSTALSIVQPTKTSNYIIKITPDVNSATASGVTSLGGMTGSIACGTGILCTGNTISSTPIPLALSNDHILVGNGGVATDYGSKAIFSTSGYLGIGGITSPTAWLDIEAPGSLGIVPASTATLVKMFQGSAATPVITDTPSIGIYRYEAVNIDGQDGHYPALFVEANGNDTSNVGIGVIAQTVGISGKGIQYGGGDVVGGYFSSAQVGNLAGRYSYGIFSAATAGVAGMKAIGVETASVNTTGSDAGYNPASNPSIAGIHIAANGANLNTVGMYIDGGGSTKYDVGIALKSNILTSSIQDNTSSLTSIKISGSHTDGIDLTGGTFSGKIIKSTGFDISLAGVGTFTGVTNNIFTGIAGAGIQFTASAGQQILFAVSGGAATYAFQGNTIYPNPDMGIQLGTASLRFSQLFLGTTASTSSITGSLISSGGIGIAGAGWFGTYINITPTVVNSLPSCVTGIDGARAFVTNNNTAVSFGGAVTTGGTTHSPVYCDGSSTSWKQG